MELFGVPWDRLERSHVEQFLGTAGEEGINWEAKGGGPSGEPPRAETIRKAACGLANQIGGYLIVGASRAADGWQLDGVARPTSEPALWLGQILRGLQPVPRFDVCEPFDLDEGKIALVARIDPVAVSPCMTPHGRIYERVSGETLPVEDPSLLERLFRRGEQARSRSEHFARRAAERVSRIPTWTPDRSVSVSVGLGSVGRETDDISSRLFTASMHDCLGTEVWELHGEVHPLNVDVSPTQDSYTAVIDSQRNQHLDGDEVTGVFRTTYLIQANWDGSVGVGVWSADRFPPGLGEPESLISSFWSRAADVSARLGGYGPAHLSVRVVVATSGEVVVVRDEARAAGRPPDRASIYGRLPDVALIDRYLESPAPDEDVVASIGRELSRAGGVRADESI